MDVFVMAFSNVNSLNWYNKLDSIMQDMMS